MRIFLIIFAIVAVIVIASFIWLDYKSRKESDSLQTNGKEEKNAMYWINSLFPVIYGNVRTVIRKKRKPEDEDKDNKDYKDIVNKQLVNN